MLAPAPALPVPAQEADPFDLDAALVVDTTAGPATRACDTSDGCTPTCASSCLSGS